MVGRTLVIVCHCNIVSDRTIREAIRDGACTRSAVARRCGAGNFCGGCVPEIDALLATERARPEPAGELGPSALARLAPA